MFKTLFIEKDFFESRKIENFIFKLTPRDKYIIEQYQQQMGIENRSSWILKIIEKDILEKIELGFVDIY